MGTPDRKWVAEDPDDDNDDDWGVGPLPARRHGRALALQVLFEVDASGHPPETALAWGLEETPAPPQVKGFAEELVRGVLEHKASLDTQLQRFAPVWPVRQLALVDRNILRLAIYELTKAQGMPPKVVINEAVELAKLFGAESSPRFVNGVLGALLESLTESPRP